MKYQQSFLMNVRQGHVELHQTGHVTQFSTKLQGEEPGIVA